MRQNHKKNPSHKHKKIKLLKRERENEENKPQRDEIKSYFLFDKLRIGGIAKVLLLPLLTSVVDVITDTFWTIFKQLFVIAFVYCF